LVAGSAAPHATAANARRTVGRANELNLGFKLRAAGHSIIGQLISARVSQLDFILIR